MAKKRVFRHAFNNAIEEGLEEIIASIATLVIMLVLMSVCMYFIMRSSLMNRIKEIGVYRVVGVSKRNLIFNTVAVTFD